MKFIEKKTGLSAASLFVLAFAGVLAAAMSTAAGCHASPAAAATPAIYYAPAAGSPPVIFLPAPVAPVAAPPAVTVTVTAPPAAAEVCDPNDPNSSCRQARSVSVLVRRSVSGDCGDCGAFGRLKAAGGRVVSAGRFIFGRQRRLNRRG